MSYIALYRKYRPKDFNNIVGQNNVKDALKYQIDNGKVGHSYIFSGIRGTGKTTMAKVFAKAVNCLDPSSGEPCNKCDSCINFDKGASIDIIELDAASNNGVDDIRELRENSHLMPAYNKYKVYIIDEVQMLSNGAFNALLKTLEEPSENVIFILATTEINKIPDTILSRCQRYNFKRISSDDMVSRLEKILKLEAVEYEREALEIISKHSGGALRDAESLLDKTLSYTTDKLTYDVVVRSLGLIEADEVHSIIISIMTGDVENAYLTFNNLINNGKVVEKIIVEIMDFIRSILVNKVISINSDISKFDTKRYIEDYIDIPEHDLKELLAQLEDLYKNLRFVYSPILSFEFLLIDWGIKKGSDKKVRVKKVIEKRAIEEIEEEKPSKLDEKRLISNWAYFVDEVKQRDALVYAYIVECKPKSVEDGIVKVSVGKGFDYYVDSINEPKVNELLREALNKVYKGKYRLIAEIEEKEEHDEIMDFFGSNITIKE